jgi:23S rRNA (uracil1939-C5)-methyltransferase
MTGEIIEVQLDTMAHGGSALGRQGGRVVFVPYTIPGERVQARVVQDKGRTVFAEGETLLEASADRVFPRCPHFGAGKCSRCQWQHIDYAAQLLLKQDVLADQLERIGGFSAPDIRPIIASPQQWGYNARMTMQVSAAGALGFPANRTITPIRECHILHPDLLALKDSLDLDSMSGLQELTLQLGSDGAGMIVIRMANDQPPELVTDVAMSVNMLLDDNQPVNLIGETHSRYTVKDQAFRATAGSFFRANLAQMDALVEVVMDALDLNGREAVLDLYAGVGLFSAFIAPRARLVTLVESYPPAVSDAEENLADVDNLDILEGAVEDVLGALDDPYDAALLDPPGRGLTVDTLDALADARIARLVYVSSDPATLARDGKRLSAAGYHLASVQPIDCAPQTYYVDSVARFEKQHSF